MPRCSPAGGVTRSVEGECLVMPWSHRSAVAPVSISPFRAGGRPHAMPDPVPSSRPGPDSVQERLERVVRDGRAPDAQLVADVASAERGLLGEQGTAATWQALRSAVLGAGPLEELLADVAVTDIAVNGDGRVWVDRGVGMVPTDVAVGAARDCRVLAVRLAALAGRRLDEAAPFVDGILPSGVRLHAILPPLVSGGAHITLRVPARRPFALAELVDAGMVPREWVDELTQVVRSRVSFVISGGTGAGKTTLLAALLGESDPGDRIVVVEDVREVRLAHPHVVHLEGRPPNVEGAGEVTMVALVRQALRMRPDRLVVGEVRGAEVRELLAALNTGHDGGCGTLHANAPGDVVARFEALGALAGMPSASVHAQLRSAVHVVLHVRRHGDGRRVLDSVGVVSQDRGEPVVRTALARGGGGSIVDPDARVRWDALLVGRR